MSQSAYRTIVSDWNHEESNLALRLPLRRQTSPAEEPNVQVPELLTNRNAPLLQPRSGVPGLL